MKARLISVLLVLALLVTVGVIAAQAATPTSWTSLENWNDVYEAAKNYDFTSSTCPCGATGVTWTELTAELAANTLPAGHYYLSADVALKDQTLKIGSGYTCINLNEKKLSSNQTVINLTTGAYRLAIMGDGTVECTADDEVITTGSNDFHLAGGTYKNAANATSPVILGSGRGTRATYIHTGVKVEGVVKCTLGTATTQTHSLYISGGEIEEVQLSISDTSKYTGRYGAELSGAPVIGKLVFPEGRKVSVNNLVSGASIGVEVVGQFTQTYADPGNRQNTSEWSAEDVSGYAQYFTPVNPLYQIKVSADNDYLECVPKDNVATCEACGKAAEIITVNAEAELPTALAGHYKLTSNLDLTTPLTVAADVCIDLGAYNVTNDTGLVLSQTGGTLNVVGTGTVTGASAAETDNAATIQVTGGNVTLKDCTIEHTSTSTKPTLYIEGEDTVAKLNGVTLTADTGVIGSNLHIQSAEVEIRDSLIENGTATRGGNIYNKNGDINFYNSIIQNGTATETGENLDKVRGGGNIYTETGTLNYDNTKVLSVLPEDIVEGTTPYTAANGGSIYHRSGSEYFKNGSEVKGGYAENNGGACFLYAGTMHFYDGTFKGGMATRGAFLAQVPDNEYSQNNSTLWVAGGTFYEGMLHTAIAADRGKTILVRGGKMNLSGGTFNSTSVGTSGKERGCAINIAPTSYTATLILTEHTTSAYAGPDLVIEDAYPENAIRVSSSEKAHVTLSSRFNNNVELRYEGRSYGELVANGVYSPANNVPYTGSVKVSSLEGSPELIPTAENGLVVANVKVDDTWYTAQGAYEAGKDNFQLLGDATLTLADKANVKVDLNGNDVNVTVAEEGQTATLNAYNSDATAASAVTLGEGVSLANTELATWNTDHYDVVLGENDEYTIHRLEMRIKSISLRPGTEENPYRNGLYYTSEIIMDSTLKALATEIGIVMAVQEDKDSGFVIGEEEFTYQQYIINPVCLDDTENVRFISPDEITSTVNSVLVNNILKADAENNADRATWVIHGAPVVVLGDETILIGQECKSYSMKDYMQFAEDKFNDLTSEKQEGLNGFYTTWESVMSGWGLTKIAGWTANTEA